MNALFFDPVGGAAGDMIVASLLDLGAPGLDVDWLRGALGHLGIEGYAVRVERARRGPLDALRFIVDVAGEAHTHAQGHGHHHDHGHEHRRHRDIRHVIEGSRLTERTRGLALAVFQALAEAEAAVHGMAVEDVTFHEVGAVDSIVDIVGVALCLERLGYPDCYAGPLPVGSGTITSQHGPLPVPAPATALLLRGIPVVPAPQPGEQVTPTGAAILRTVVRSWGAFPPADRAPARITHVGYGAGMRAAGQVPNVLRTMAFTGSAAADRERLVLLETNIDDATPQLLAFALEESLARGALDAWITPILGKKNRAAHLVSLLCRPGQRAELEELLLAQTPTLGVRASALERRSLPRRMLTVDTSYGPVAMKVATLPDGTERAHPEYEDLAALARSRGVPLRDVEAAAMAAWRGRGGDRGA